MRFQGDARRFLTFRCPAFLFLWTALSFPNASLAYPAQGDEVRFTQLREQMVEQQLVQPHDARAAIRDRRVLEAMRQTPRHLFVPPGMTPLAYEDSPLPIGQGQTISQPYVVAKMTELAEARSSDRALEVGTGSGYQAAVLASLVAEVYTIEIVEPLGVAARERFRALGYKNITARIGDGYQGWPEKAPFDIILVTAAADKIPPRLVEQLRPGGRMVIPLRKTDQMQMLTLVRKGSKDPADISIQEVLLVRFVPLVTSPREKK
jgi:protein-L-isoaspartate(D-aspartate) O-methyltransferase